MYKKILLRRFSEESTADDQPQQQQSPQSPPQPEELQEDRGWPGIEEEDSDISRSTASLKIDISSLQSQVHYRASSAAGAPAPADAESPATSPTRASSATSSLTDEPSSPQPGPSGVIRPGGRPTANPRLDSSPSSSSFSPPRPGPSRRVTAKRPRAPPRPMRGPPQLVDLTEEEEAREGRGRRLQRAIFYGEPEGEKFPVQQRHQRPPRAPPAPQLQPQPRRPREVARRFRPLQDDQRILLDPQPPVTARSRNLWVRQYGDRRRPRDQIQAFLNSEREARARIERLLQQPALEQQRPPPDLEAPPPSPIEGPAVGDLDEEFVVQEVDGFCREYVYYADGTRARLALYFLVWEGYPLEEAC